MSVVRWKRCAWCGATMAGAPTARPEETSHGICRRCSERVERGEDVPVARETARKIDALAAAVNATSRERLVSAPDGGLEFVPDDCAPGPLPLVQGDEPGRPSDLRWYAFWAVAGVAVAVAIFAAAWALDRLPRL